MENNTIDQERPDSKVRVFTHLTQPPSRSLLDSYARMYRLGFNQAPWDIYEYNYTVESAREEFARLVLTSLSSGGALISLSYKGKPAGCSVIASLGLFIRELPKETEYSGFPPNNQYPGRYLELLSQLLQMPQTDFESTGYIADVVVSERHRGKGYGKTLVLSSLNYLRDNGKKYALAWTVNPVMGKILSQLDFKLIEGIGNQGEGLDFTVRHGLWYPVTVVPAKRKTLEAVNPVIARHFFKIL